MADACKTCATKDTCKEKECPQTLKEMQPIKNVIAVMSGKGGVGKSSVSSLLTVGLLHKGFKVGIMDADITGPSIPKIFGLTGRILKESAKGLIPAKTKSGIEVMSINLLLEKEDEPVIWRGPVISGVIRQFWTEVQWGPLDYLIVDLPPGTGDAPLTVMQTLPLTGAVIVTSPQSLVAMVVKKAIHMSHRLNIPVLGIVENMAYLECPDCKKKINVFGQNHTEELVHNMNVSLLGRLPLDPVFVEYCDQGQIEKYYAGQAALKQEVDHIIEQLIEREENSREDN